MRIASFLQGNKLSHAILFSGEEGSGALPLALSLAQYLTCTQKKEDVQACGTCPSCHKNAKLIHPDVSFIVPINRPKGSSGSRPPVTEDYIDLWRKAYTDNPMLTEQDWYRRLDIENKQGIISVAEAESLLKRIQLKPMESDVKVLIIWLPERMHVAAANKLLKALEEPPAGTYFLLVTEHAQQLLPTIRSRCMLLPVPSTQAKPVREEEARLFLDLMEACLTGKPTRLLAWAEDVATTGRENQKSLIANSLRTLREIYMVRLGVLDLVHLDDSCRTRIAPWVSRIPLSFFETAYVRLNTATGHVERNVNARALFCSLAFDFFLTLTQ